MAFCRCRSVACCCLDSRTGSVLTGMLNLVFGTVGLVSLYFILTGLTQEMNQLQRTERLSSKIEQKLDDLAERYWAILLSYAFSSVVTFLVGITVILSTVKNNEYLLLISVVMSGILIIAVFSISVILFVLSFPSSFIAPHWIWGLVQTYFSMVLLTYRNDIVHYKPEIHEDNDFDDGDE
ncbi:uncharacterized protein LOC110856249 [Folsomia candida]|uniref:Uncharacterized protein n=1 Tax=Folsomia candida TaxID=158441 RepID=A0A226DN57_FOLCA|nr:uncharacterized protein LOC110856249 [Folsomia candida]OXA46438.1 hypothetical protein Fcan01_18653 [Folsomia candida]